MKYYVYILYSESLRQYYTGSTQDISKRLTDHNNGWSLHTSKGIPWTLVYSEPFETKKEALQKENNIKKRGAGRFLSCKG